MLYYLRNKRRNINPKRKIFGNNNNFAGASFSLAPCNFRISIETFIDSVLSFNRNICDNVNRTKQQNFTIKTNNISANKVSDSNFTELLTSITTSKTIVTNFESQSDSITVTKSTVIT